MSAIAKAAATRSNLVVLRRRLDQVRRGAALLRRKRESLVAELFDRARPAVDARRAIEEAALVAYRALLEALASAGRAQLRALGWPTREIRVELVPRDVWGIRGVELRARSSIVRSFAARGAVSGIGDAPAEDAAERFERLLDLLVAAAPEELFMRRLGEALSRTTRLVNTLEQRVAASLAREAQAMRRTLEEREREEHLRLKRFARATGSGR